MDSTGPKIHPVAARSRLIFRIVLGALCLFLFTLVCALLNFSNFAVIYFFSLLALIALFKPNYALYVLVFLLPFFGNNPGGKYSLFFIDELVLLLLLRWLVPLIFAKNPRIKCTSYAVWIWLFFLVTLISIFPLRHEFGKAYFSAVSAGEFMRRIYTAYAVDFFWSVRLTLDLFISILFFFYIINNVSQEAHLRKVAFCALSGFFLAITLGILDFHNVIDLTFIRPLNRDIQRFGYRRLMGLFWHSGWFAEYIVLLAPYYLASFFVARRKPGKWDIILILMIVYAIVFTYQRAGWISFAASVLVLLVLGRRRLFMYLSRPRVLATVLVMLFIAGAGFTFLVTSHRTAQTHLASRLRKIFFAEDRTRIWDQAILLYRKKPLLGIGAGNYYYYHRTNFPLGHPYYDSDKVTAHSTYLHILVERGPFALLVFLILIGMAFRMAAITLKRTRNASFRHTLAAASFVSLVGFAVYGLAQYMFYVRIVGLLLWFTLAMTVIAGRGVVEDYCPLKRRGNKIALAAFVAFLLIILAFCPTARDLFHWHRFTADKERYLDSWVDPWDEFRIDCYSAVIEAQVTVLHPDVKTNPVRVDMTVNGEPAASISIRDHEYHKIAARIPSGHYGHLRIRFRVSRPVRTMDIVTWLKDKTPRYCIVQRTLRCRPLGSEGIGFSKWETAAGHRFRWTDTRCALCDIRVSSPTLALEILAANPDLAQKPLSVSLTLSDNKGNRIAIEQLRFLAPKVVRRVRFDLARYTGKTLRLRIETDRTFCPLDYGGADTRNLGVYVSEPLWESLPEAR